MEGNVTGLPGQKCTLQGFNFVNLTLDFEIATPSENGLIWQLQGHPTFHIGAIELKVKQFTW